MPIYPHLVSRRTPVSAMDGKPGENYTMWNRQPMDAALLQTC